MAQSPLMPYPKSAHAYIILLKILQNLFEKLLKETHKPGYCDIICKINIASEELSRNVNLNLVVDNLLMSILEIKYKNNL